jgi:hypothetical protein
MENCAMQNGKSTFNSLPLSQLPFILTLNFYALASLVLWIQPLTAVIKAFAWMLLSAYCGWWCLRNRPRQYKQVSLRGQPQEWILQADGRPDRVAELCGRWVSPWCVVLKFRLENGAHYNAMILNQAVSQTTMRRLKANLNFLLTD